MLDSKTIRLVPAAPLEREKSCTIILAGGQAGLKDSSGTDTDYRFSFTTLETLKLLRHYYQDGSYDKNYTNFETADSDNYTDNNVQIHAWIVLEFNLPVDASSIAEKLLVVRNNKGTAEIANSAENNFNIIGRINNSFPDATLRGQFIGELKADPVDNTRLIFEHHLVFYANPGGAFDWEHPNWNGIKPNYQYDVSVQDGILDSIGGALAPHNPSSNRRNWSFTTTDLDYGLYWFKSAWHGLKYLPGRAIPAAYYDPQKPVLIHCHGWQKNSTGHMKGSNGQGNFRDYRRENFLWGGTTDFKWDVTRATIDALDPWLHGSDLAKYPQGGGKDWNVGCVYWTQYSDNEDKGGTLGLEGPLKPRRAGTAAWSVYGPSSQADGKAEYAVNTLQGGRYLMTRIATNTPNKALSTIFSDTFSSAFGNRPSGYDAEFRLTGHSLGNQMAHAILMTLKTRHAAGLIDDTLMPTRFFIIDPYWVDNGFWQANGSGSGEDWNKPNAPLATGYWNRLECPARPLVTAGIISGNPSPGVVCTAIIRNVQQYYENTGIKGRNYLATEMYDVSRTCDGKVVGLDAGDKNEPYREEVTMIYSHYQWIGNADDSTGSWGYQHNNSRYQVFYNYGFTQPTGGISPRTSDEVVKVYMNCYYPNNDKGRFQYNNGTSSSDWTDDTFTYHFDKVDGGNSGAWLK